MNIIKGFLILLITLAMLSGCGGGGGEGEPPVDSGGEPAPEPAPVPDPTPEPTPDPAPDPVPGPAPTEFTLRGTISAAGGNVTDSDVNDPMTTQLSNNNYTIAQPIPNPVVLGGYVNEAGTGSVGSLYAGGDLSDYYHVYLTPGQTISLVIADSDPIANDLDLFVYREPSVPPANPELLDTLFLSSQGLGNQESITIPSGIEGLYYVEVYAYQGASNYVLSIGQTAAVADENTLDIESDFIPGDVIVQFKDKVSKDPLAQAQSLGMSTPTTAPGQAMLMKLPEASQAASQALSTLGVKRKVLKGKSVTSQQQRKVETLQAIHALRKRSDVLFAEPNYLRHAAVMPDPDDTLYSNQWHYPLINLPAAWETTTGDANVTVAVVDTGVLLNHPDLQGQLVSGYDFVSNIDYALDGNGIDSDPNDPGDRAVNTVNSSFHGTHVTGTIAAASYNGVGVAGVAWNARVMPLRALGKGGAGSSYDIMQAVRYAAGLNNDSTTVPAKIADVINLSLGGPGFSSYEQSVYDQVRAAGVVVVAAAGNSSSSSPSYPAAYSGVISVSAVNQSEALSYYSNYGSTISVAAPGGDTRSGTAGGVWSTMGNDLGYTSSQPGYFTYKAYQGTSMASPHVAGVVALMKSVYLQLTPTQLDGLLACGLLTKDLGVVGRDDQFGYGLIDANKAVTAALALASGGSGCSMLQTNPSQLNFGNAIQSLTLDVSNVGSGNPVISSVTDDAAWLTVTPINVDATTKLGSYNVAVDRTQLTVDGIYRATIVFASSSAESLSVPVTLQRISGNVESDAGYLYIILADATTLTSTQSIHQAAVAGKYNYSFSGIPAGQYYVVASTNNNNDGIVCEPGEACGVYSGFASFDVSGDMDGLDFEAGYDVRITGPQFQSLENIVIDSGAKIKKLGF